MAEILLTQIFSQWLKLPELTGDIKNLIMNRNYIAAAFEKRCPEPGSVVPIWELEFHLWNKFSMHHLTVGREFERLSPKQQDKALHINAEIFIDVSKKLNFSAITLPGGYWEIAPGQSAYFWLPDKAKLEQIRIIDKESDDLMLITSNSGIMAMPEANDFVEFSLKLFDAPQEIDILAREKFQQGMEAAKRLVDYGIDALYSASDLADNRGPYYSPDQMERFIWPYFTAWVSQVKRMGVYTILHSDGNLMPYVENIANSGVDALQAIDPIAGMDIRKVKEKVGDRLCLCGNIDCGLMLTGLPEEVFNATRDLLTGCKHNGGLVLGASNALQEEVPAENYLAMIDAWKKYGVY